MQRTLRLISGFSRKYKKELDPQEIQILKSNLFEKCQKKGYKNPDEFNHQDIIYEEKVYGNKCQIAGVTQNNLKSAEFVKQVIGSGRPKLVILGGLNDTQAMALLDQPMGRFLNIQNLTAAKLFCKTTLLPLLQKKVQQEIHYYYDKKDKVLWKADLLNRSFYVNDYFNAAYESLFMDYKIIYGKPSSIFIYEDLMLTLSLQQLQQMFENTLKRVMQKHQNSCEGIVSVVLQQIKTYSMYQQPKLYSKQVTYTTALLNRLTKIQNKNLLLMPTCFVKKVADQVHTIDFQPQSIYRKWVDDSNSESYSKFSSIMMDKKVEELLEKFAILSILKGFHLQLLLHDGKNFFKNSIFSQLLGHYQPQQILQIYRPLKSKYLQKVFNIQRQRIKNKITYHPPQTEYMYLNDQFNTLQKRKQMFLYEFEPKNFITQAENAQKTHNLLTKIDQIVELQCDEYEKKLVEEYKKGNRSKQSIILYTKLIGKANVELKDKVKIPYFHFNAFRGFYKDYYRESLLFNQDIKQKKLQMKKMRKLEQKFDQIGKQIKDPHTLRKYLTGQMGPVKQLNFYEDENGEMDFDGQMDDLQQVVAEMGNDEMKKDFQEFRKTHPKKENQYFNGEQFPTDEDDQVEHK